MPTEAITSISSAVMDAVKNDFKDEAEGHWVGELKKRYDFVLKYLEKKSTSRGYFVYRFTDKNGALFIAFDGRESLVVPAPNEDSFGVPIDPDADDVIEHELTLGDCFTCKATVNRHSINTFKYGTPNTPHKETVLNRIKLGRFLGRK